MVMATGDVRPHKGSSESGIIVYWRVGYGGTTVWYSSLVIANLLLGRQHTKTHHQWWPNKERATVEHVLLLKGKTKM